MKKTVLKILSLLFVLLLFSCSTTGDMLSDTVLDESLSFTQKLEALDIPSFTMDYPECIFSGPEWSEKLVEMLENTEDYFIATFFLGAECDINKEIIDKMKEKAQSGVDIYIVFDSASLMDMTESRYYMRTLYSLEEYGVHLLEHNRFSSNRILWLNSILYREHRKFFVSDGKYVAFGGMNLNYISLSSVENGGERDSMYFTYSPSLAKLIVDDFIEFWNDRSWETIDADSLRTYDCEELEVTGYFGNQHPGNWVVSSIMGSAFASAENEILCIAFTPTLDENMAKSIERCTSDGVKVQFVIRRSGRVGMDATSDYVYKDLIDAGVDVKQEYDYLGTGSKLHEKLIIIDERYLIVGSANMNWRSTSLSYETFIVIDNEKLAKELKLHYLNDVLEYTYDVTEEMADECHTFFNGVMYYILRIGG